MLLSNRERKHREEIVEACHLKSSKTICQVQEGSIFEAHFLILSPQWLQNTKLKILNKNKNLIKYSNEFNSLIFRLSVVIR